MTSQEHIDRAQTAIADIPISPGDPNYVVLHLLFAIAQDLRSIDARQSGITA